MSLFSGAVGNVTKLLTGEVTGCEGSGQCYRACWRAAGPASFAAAQKCVDTLTICSRSEATPRGRGVE